MQVLISPFAASCRSGVLPATVQGGRALRVWMAAAVLLLNGFSLPARAQLDAYSGEVAVSDRGDEEQKEAFELAMREVLLANSGDKTLLNRDDVRQGLRDANTFVEQFRYRTPEPGTLISRDTPVTRAVLASGQATQLLLVRFDPERVDALIAAEPAAVEEPDVVAVADESSALVWMLIEDGDRQMLVAGDRVMNVQRRAREIAGAGGLALSFPAGDGIDRAVVSIESLLRLPPLENEGRQSVGGQTQRDANDPTSAVSNAPIGDDAGPSSGLPGDDPQTTSSAASDANASDSGGELRDVDEWRAVSERYAEPVILVAHLRRNPLRGWAGAWLRIAGEAVRETQIDTDTLDEGLQEGIAWLSPMVSNAVNAGADYDYGGAGVSESEALVWVGALDTTAGYAEIMRLLGEIDTVNLAYPKEINPAGMLFAVVPRTALRDVGRVMTGNPSLRRSAGPPAGAGGELARNAELTLDYIGR